MDDLKNSSEDIFRDYISGHDAISAVQSAYTNSPLWPSLRDLGLSSAAVTRRRNGIGGSDANVLLAGDNARLLRLWQEKRGEIEPEDLTGKLAVMLGCWTESFNRQWYEQLTGRQVSSIGLQLTCSKHSWRQCTLDGLVDQTGEVFEAKHTNSFVRPEEVLVRYMPQLQHNMAVADVSTLMRSRQAWPKTSKGVSAETTFAKVSSR